MDFSVLELNVDRKLLKSNFDGYKLSLEPLPVLKNPLQAFPDRVTPGEEQYSFLHAELFSLHNHLVQDSWTSDTSYYIDDNWNVRRVQFNLQEGRFSPIASVFRLKKTPRLPEHYNLSIIFISEKFAIIGDGIASIEIVDTGNRIKEEQWKQIARVQILPAEEKVGFVLKDARLEIVQEAKIIHLALLRIEKQEEGFDSVLNWIAITLPEGTIKFRRELRSKSSISYISLTSNCSGLIVAAGKPIKFTYDSENPVQEIKIADEGKLSALYKWKQTDKTVEIFFEAKENAEKDDLAMSYCEGDQKIVGKHKEETFLEGKLFGQIDPDRITIELDENLFHIVLTKKTEGEKWLYLIPGSPIELYDEDSQEMTREMTEISTLSTPMEECDQGDDDFEFFICRLDGESHKITHKANLGSLAPLFSVILRPGQPSAVALRHDIDCLVWLPLQTRTEWNLRHEGTLDAFAYVLASKQQRKYVSCSPDMTYSVICEAERHVFLYNSTYKSAGGLRRRSGPQVTMGQQKVISLDDIGGQIIGISVQNHVTFLLTEKFILCLQVNVE